MSKALAYSQCQDRNSLLMRHVPLVKRIACHLMGRLPPSVLLEDLVQAGMIGLLEAQQNYDASKGASFETYAGIRIRGAMLDEIRRGDWIPRSVHRNSRSITEAIENLEKQLGRDPRDHEVAAYMEVSLDEYHHMLQDVNGGKVIGFDDLGVPEDMAFAPEARHDDLPFQGVENDNFQQALADAIRSLPEREALVLSLYYDEELNLKEIGAVLGVSESRISQILSQTMHRLRAKLHAWSAV
ncbi:RNA polymerase sigma factor FliA [Plesiomonas shigelloides]|uniref:RNA polymerase sigma factor FliA n=1 Tax=Plesiomonas shigelloides TaxID=703 RepID=UPI00126208B6|nr:RNA polymerase sigma factor FliA [Plesiomonas shigelloides]KAB7686437.1 FliA/WhiG family RNA polymerase sigma factor [Plesiomonas shigelloides]